ncbi:MAG TPA: hypothetical protein VFN56_03810 [Candidatus Saccharimonadales bacterium]|nr:hypothetical protein [Candidatus Saccharimonadales bacterium]
MTKLLSELLGAKEPEFRLGLLKLEKLHGAPSTDVRLTAELMQATSNKIKQLMLDPHDTTGSELYHALQERLRIDDKYLEKALRTVAATHISAECNLMEGMVHALKLLPLQKTCFAMKTSVLRRLLSKQVPKRTMKQLGYRSHTSMVKHESAVHLLAASWLIESVAWRRNFIQQYEKLTPQDFEIRQIEFTSPTGKKWDAFVSQVVADKRHTVISFNELGSIVLLPIPTIHPSGMVTAATGLALHAINDIRASSTFLKLSRVKKDFGHIVQSIALDVPVLRTPVLDQTVPWHILQRYYARATHLFNEALYEPHIQREDMSWHAIEHALSSIEPRFTFWQDTSYLSRAYEHLPVSLNVLDVAVNICNHVPYANRIVQYGRDTLQHELMLRYLKHDTIEQAIASELQPQFAMENAVA